MESNIAFASSVLTCIFSLVSWSITAHLLPAYRALSQDYSIDSDWGSGLDGGSGSGYGSGNGYGWGSGSGTGSSSGIGSSTGSGSGSGTGYGSSTGSGYGSNAGSGYGSSTGSGYGSNTGSGYGSSTGSGYGSSSGSGYSSSSNRSGSGYGYASYASNSRRSYSTHGIKAPLAVSAVGMAIAILIFLVVPVFALHVWKEKQGHAARPRWLSRTLLGLSILGFVIAIAEFGVLGHYKILTDEPAAQAAMLFLAGIFGIAASAFHYLPTSWVDKLQLQTRARPQDQHQVKDMQEDPSNRSEQA
ncbi:hypothetical protein EX895_001888 [Sporisorium graminicola]|uniref:Uncharacterized protein n=1 Tax=Sporisorium graminicola TaxID=280036 RepID=A0A4U7KYL0_9BASI|nr:hypothetical protein EX895_001888 [Sporisorium graminicola]TKY89357.1 hypothetical protein EX895_001888 [Sporisorium graminicola]